MEIKMLFNRFSWIQQIDCLSRIPRSYQDRQVNPQVNLVDTLNGSEFTVFAPVDEAFAKIDSATIDGLKTNSAELSGSGSALIVSPWDPMLSSPSSH